MQNRPRAKRIDVDGPDPGDFDRYTDYDDGAALVICDRRNARAWIKSDATTTLDP